eukprot:CAMPEP_0178997462 /NCGR_PEP_ID=MMETSP0795-20121207/8939_1 /TAXON_ID=88552 /ORGANISM="Amoebophrya sp., Strain Ameob2" /LENGTH=354 /DNA_ID=CAMNT_0020689969 /DNA_START=59 /DNA_END=1123 /DNA_ORIENTATION=-
MDFLDWDDVDGDSALWIAQSVAFAIALFYFACPKKKAATEDGAADGNADAVDDAEGDGKKGASPKSPKPKSPRGASASRGRSSTNAADGKIIVQDVEPHHLRPKKTISMAYFYYFFGGFLFGTHHIYLENYDYAFYHIFTFGYLLIGMTLDLFLIPVYVMRYNRNTHPEAEPPNGLSFFRLLRTALKAVAIGVLLLLVFAAGFPWVYETATGEFLGNTRLGLSTKNPYDVLEIPRNSGLSEAKIAYKKLSMQYHPDKTGGESAAKMAEINTAYQALKKSPSGFANADDFNEAIEDWSHKWMTLLEKIKTQLDKVNIGDLSKKKTRKNNKNTSKQNAAGGGGKKQRTGGTRFDEM